MKNHELLDMIGEVNEDYVLAAGDNAARPRFRRKAWAVCAACAALALCAYPIWRAAQPRDLPFHGTLALHAYTVVEGGGASLTTQSDVKAQAGGADALGEEDIPMPEPAPAPIPGGAYVGGDSGDPYDESGKVAIGSDVDGEHYAPAWQDAPAQEEALAQYDGLLRGLGLYPEGDLGQAPEWFGGAWLDNDWPDNVARLTVAIADGFRTPELEARIVEWCGGTGDVLFCGAKYSYAYLQGLMDPVVRALKGTSFSCGIGVHEKENCLGVDIYSGDGSVPDRVLAELARLDPDGDAIRVRVFVGSLSTQADVVKCPPEPAADPVDPEARATPVVPPVENDPGPEPTPAHGSDCDCASCDDDKPVEILPGGATQPAVIYGAGK